MEQVEAMQSVDQSTVPWTLNLLNLAVVLFLVARRRGLGPRAAAA